MLSVKIILDERSERKAGTCPLKIRVIIKLSSFHISLGHSIFVKDWDDVNQRIKLNSKTVSSTTRFNASLNGRKQEVYEVLLKLQDEGLLDDLSIDRIKSYLTKNSAESFALEFGEEIIEELVQGRKIGNARVYRTMFSSLRTFLNRKDIPLRQINYSFIKKYEAWHLGKGNAINGLSVHLRALRALINRAIKERRLPKHHNPFSNC